MTSRYRGLSRPRYNRYAMINACRTTRIYCLEDCPPGRRTRPENRVSFSSRNEAEAAGYRACKVCRPDLYHGAWVAKRQPA